MSFNYMCQMLAHQYIFKPPKRSPLARYRKSANERFVRSIDGDDIHCQLVVSFDSPSTIETYERNPNGVILTSHGNADDIASFHSYAQFLADRCQMSVVVYDYPGYGFSSGDLCTTDANMFTACEAALRFVTETLKHPVEDITVLGKSIGTVPAVQLAAQPHMAQCNGLVLISPLASGARCMISESFLKHIPTAIMTSLDLIFGPSVHRISDVQTLVFVTHGQQDTIIPISNAHDLLAHCATSSYYPPLFVEAGHNDLEGRFTGLFANSLADFIAAARDRQRARSDYQGTTDAL